MGDLKSISGNTTKQEWRKTKEWKGRGTKKKKRKKKKKTEMGAKL